MMTIQQRIEREKSCIEHAQTWLNIALLNGEIDQAMKFQDEIRRSLQSIKLLMQEQDRLRELAELIQKHDLKVSDLYAG